MLFTLFYFLLTKVNLTTWQQRQNLQLPLDNWCGGTPMEPEGNHGFFDGCLQDSRGALSFTHSGKRTLWKHPCLVKICIWSCCIWWFAWLYFTFDEKSLSLSHFFGFTDRYSYPNAIFNPFHQIHGSIWCYCAHYACFGNCNCCIFAMVHQIQSSEGMDKLAQF